MRREIKESGNCVMSPDGEILAFPDGEGARRADRVDYHERSEVLRFSSVEDWFKGVDLAPKEKVVRIC